MFTKAIVKIPAKSLHNGLSQAGLGRADYASAMRQHRNYIQALQACGLEVVVLEADEALPDSVFVEDTAVLLEDCAVVTRPGAPSRREETVAVQAELVRHVPRLEFIAGDGCLDGGDVMRIGRTLYIGLSSRTNQSGADQLARIARARGYQSVQVPLDTMLHLKTGVNYLADNHLLVTGEFVHREVFEDFERIVVPQHEAYAANSLWINGHVLVPAGFPETRAHLEALGFATTEVGVSEFQKLDGGLSCLSLRL